MKEEVKKLNTYRLRKLPTVPNVDDGLNYCITICVNERQGYWLIHDWECKLVVINKANFFNFTGIVNVIQQNWVSKHFGFLQRCHLNSSGADLLKKLEIIIWN